MQPLFNADICIIGAGPAGCITARRLAEMGYRVCIIESKTFPRPHVGICFSHDTYTLLDYLGIKEAVEKCGFYQRTTTLVKWQPGQPVATPQTGFHANRGIFDQLLLQGAVAAGVQVIQPARAQHLSQLGDGWKVEYELNGTRATITARFVVDASGAGTILPGKKIKMAPPLFAMHAVWQFTTMPPYDGFIEAAKDSWLWFARLNDTEGLITLFTAPKHFLQSGSGQLEAHYRHMLQQFQLLQSCQLDAVKGSIEGCDAGSRFSTDPAGGNFIRVGDASIKVDPLASQGVHLAMSSALQAAAVVNTILKTPANAQHAMDFYRHRQQERVHQFTTKTAAAYRQVSQYSHEPFWRERSGGGKEEASTPEFNNILPGRSATPELDIPLPDAAAIVQLCPHTDIKPIPVMQDDLIVPLPALHHPSLPRPVAYVGGHAVVPLLLEVGSGQAASELIALWGRTMPVDTAIDIFGWLWGWGVLVESS